MTEAFVKTYLYKSSRVKCIKANKENSNRGLGSSAFFILFYPWLISLNIEECNLKISE